MAEAIDRMELQVLQRRQLGAEQFLLVDIPHRVEEATGDWAAIQLQGAFE